MSVWEHDAWASKADTQKAETVFKITKINKLGFMVINNRPCKVIFMSTTKFSQSRKVKCCKVKCHFVGIDIFTGKKHSVIVPGDHICEIPHVNRTDYQLINISEDGFMNLLTENGGTKDDMRLPTDGSLLTKINVGFAEGKNLVLSVMSAMGEEHVFEVKGIDSKVSGRKRSWRECDVCALGEEHICGVKKLAPSN